MSYMWLHHFWNWRVRHTTCRY